MLPSNLLSTGMAVCHTLSLSKERGVIIGNAVDTMMFESTKAKIESVSVIEYAGAKLQILKRFDFSHEAMVQSVIMRGEEKEGKGGGGGGGGRARIFVKGSPEAVKKLCQPGTLPPQFDALALSSAKEGVYQLAMAHRDLLPEEVAALGGLEHVGRGHLEREESLTFLGFLNFKNVLKDDTPTVIRELHEGGVRTVMVTRTRTRTRT